MRVPQSELRQGSRTRKVRCRLSDGIDDYDQEFIVSEAEIAWRSRENLAHILMIEAQVYNSWVLDCKIVSII